MGLASRLKTFFFSSRRGHTICGRDWSSDVCSSDLRGLRVDGDVPGRTRHDIARFGNQLRKVGGAAPELGPERLRVELADVRAKRLDPRPVGGRAAGLPTASPKHLRLPPPRLRSELVSQAAFADSRLARDEEEPAATVECLVQPGCEG